MSLRLRITIASLISVLIASVGLLIASEMISNAWLDRFQASTLRANNTLWTKIVSSQQDAMESALTSVTRDRKVRKLIKQGDKQGLQEEASPAFRRLNASNIISNEQLIDSKGNILFSMPNPESGMSNKLLVGSVLKENKTLRGIEQDGKGAVIALAFPISQRGKTIGVGVFMRVLINALTDFKKIDQANVSVISIDGSILNSTDAELHRKINPNLPELGKSRYTEHSFKDKHFSVSIIPILNPEQKPLAHLVSIQDHTASISSMNDISRASYASIAITLILIAIFFTWYIRKSLIPIEQTANLMGKISKGKLNFKINNTFKDEVGILLTSIDTMANDLRNIISHLMNISDHLQSSTVTLQQQVETSQNGVEQQKRETDKVATAINEMTSTIHGVAQSASTAANAVKDAEDKAIIGKKIVRKATDTINALNEMVNNSAQAVTKVQTESSEIGSVLNVIRDIADQTNLLALNAAIEAARAGEQGRGFAVVADEVRTLASRTQQSTEDIETMIKRLQSGSDNTVSSMQTCLDHVEQSVNTIQETDKALDEIVSSINTINNMTIQIASASDEQSSVAEEINHNITNINNIAEESSSHMDETVKACDDINKMTQDLVKIVNRFEI